MSSRYILSAAVLFVFCSVFAYPGDWPSWQGDCEGSGVSSDPVELPLDHAWVYTPLAPPAPAWPEPGKELNRIDYDYTFYPVIGGETVFFASSSDDTVRAVDIRNGQLKWRYTAGGPVRFAPVYGGGRLFVSCDDGFLYCFHAGTGEIQWKKRIAPSDRMMLGNGRMISRWPLRSGVAMIGENLYTTSGMWPAEGVYICAMDALKGDLKWENTSSGTMYIETPHEGSSGLTGVAPQGYMLVSGKSVLVPTGRSVPGVYDKYTGELNYYEPAASKHDGSSWLTASDGLFFNESHGGGPELGASVGEAKPVPDDGLIAYSIETGKLTFKLPRKHRVVVSGNTCYASGGGSVTAYDMNALKEGKRASVSEKWSTQISRTYSLTLGGNILLAGGDGELAAFNVQDGARSWKAEVKGKIRAIAVSGQRVVAAADTGEIHCYIHSSIFIPPSESRERVSWDNVSTGSLSGKAGDIVASAGAAEGYALVISDSDAALALAVAMQSDFHVVCAVNNAVTAESERKRLFETGLYGRRISVISFTGDELPFSSYFADLVVIQGASGNVKPAEIFRMVRPCGGVLIAPDMEGETFSRFCSSAGVPDGELPAAGAGRFVRPPLKGAGEWKCQWADPGNTGIGDESLVHLPLELLWYGGPGPDRMMSRHLGTSTPLSVNGRMFVTGENSIICFNEYNGREIWVRDMPGAGKISATFIGGNFIADDDSLYLVIDNTCHRLSQKNGKTIGIFSMPDFPDAVPEQKKAGVSSSIEVQWPAEWTVFGPFDKSLPVAGPESLKEIPKQLSIGDTTLSGTALRSVNMGLDFTYLYGGFGHKTLGPGEQPDRFPRGGAVRDMSCERKTCYAMAAFETETAGELLIGAGADWWMRWFIDGKQVFDTIDSGGNRRKPFSPSNHTFRVPLEKGKHTVAVAVRSGSEGWCMVSAAGRELEERMNAVPAPPVPHRAWGYIGTSDSLIIGTSISVSNAWGAESTHIFALDRQTGTSVWSFKGEYGIPNTGVAVAGSTVYVLDATPFSEVWSARRKGEELEQKQRLLALSAADGHIIWEQDDVVPGYYRLQCNEASVVLAPVAVYDAADGKLRWKNEKITSNKPPLLHSRWIIAHPNAYDVKTGEPRMQADPLTGAGKKWKYVKAYGCGDIVGCDTMLVFRSGMFGFLDLDSGGTTNFGAVRPGCSVNIVPAGGLLIAPEGSSACTCSYNYQTSLAFIPAGKGKEQWYVYGGETLDAPSRHIRLNLGAPGDMTDETGRVWLGFPRPEVNGVCPVPAVTVNTAEDWFYAPADSQKADREHARVFSSGLKGESTIALFPLPVPPVPAVTVKEPPAVDGKIEEDCWKKAQTVRFEYYGYSGFPESRIRMCRTETDLYISFERDAVTGPEGTIPFKAEKTDPDSAVWEDDSFDIVCTDTAGKVQVYCAVSCSGAKFDQLFKPGQRRPDTAFSGPWKTGSQVTSDTWTVEICIPFSMLKEAGLDTSELLVNCSSVNTASGMQQAFLTDPGPWGMKACSNFLPLVEKRDDPAETLYTVNLYLTLPVFGTEEKSGVKAAVYGSTDCRELDIPLTEKMSGAYVCPAGTIQAASVIVIEIKQSDPQAPLPVLNGIEVVKSDQ